jgi:hypothetical protein
MGLGEAFEETKVYRHTERVRDATPADLAHVRQNVERMLVMTGLDARVETCSNAIVATFTDPNDHRVFVTTWQRANDQRSVHTIRFNDKDDEIYRRSFAAVVVDQLDDAGVTYTLDEVEDGVRVSFTSATARLMFTSLIETGYLARRTHALMHLEAFRDDGADPDLGL